MDPLSRSDGFVGEKSMYKKTHSNGTTTWVYIPNRPRSQSAGSSLSGRSSGPKPLGNGNSRGCDRNRSIEDENIRKRTNINSSRYKTELCRPYQEYGYCKYGDKCQFAHGIHELRVMPRHPKYKTELCRTYHSTGFCPYGPRCHFIHNLDEAQKPSETSGKGSPKKTPSTSLSFSMPISPSVDSGISSPDDRFSSVGNRVFEFPTESYGSLDADWNSDQFFPWEYNHYPATADCRPEVNRDQMGSPELFMEFDAASNGSSSPTKSAPALSSISEQNLDELLVTFSLEEPPTPTTGRRLPVFDDMLNSKSDTALDTAVNSGVRPFVLFA